MSCEKNHLNLHKYHLPYVLIGIFPGYPQASDFDCRISMVSFIVRYLPVNLVPLRFFVGVKFNLVIQQTIVCHGFICLVVFKQICHGKHGVKIILGVIKKKAVQIGISTIKRLYLCVGFNLPKCELFKIHNHIGKVLMALNAS